MFKLTVSLFSLGFLAVLFAVISLFWLENEAKKPGLLETEKLVYIQPGSSIRSIANVMEQETIINCHPCFLIYAKIKSRSKPMQAGEFQFPPRAGIKDIITILQEGKTYQRSVTFPEGLTSSEIVEILNANEFLSGEKIAATPAEGSLLPETYYFSKGDRREIIIERMKKAMSEKLEQLWMEGGENSLLKSKDEAVILASIVEKETGVAEERPRVAGVFANRLRLGIALQTDPTVIYAITQGKSKLDRPLMRKDLKTPSPYNTYLVKGLPPTAIANPGYLSIKAAIMPEKNDYLYFVADGTGGHVFAKSLAEHNKNVAQWRKIQKQSK